MSEKKTIDINLVELVSLAANILDKLFIKAPKDKAKAAFKDIKQGKLIPLGTVTIQDTLKPTLKIALDYSEFRGPGFNYNVFETALKGILQQISLKFQAKADLNVMSSDNGQVLIHLPGVVQIEEQFNVMVMTFDISTLTDITIRMMFLDPQQYESVRREPVS